MRILISGLGLIGGSLCKALKKYTSHTVIGQNRNNAVAEKALSDGAIDEIFNGDYSDIDMAVICFYPEATMKHFDGIAPRMRKGTVVTEVCGIKNGLCEHMHETAEKHGLHFVGLHPMAGKEKGGYDNSFAELYVNANFIITPFEESNKDAVALIETFSREVGAKKIIITTPDEHDRIIAYTSQLAHIVSNAYVKSDTIKSRAGFSAGSFQDMTRIATMNAEMWTPLFMSNRENLISEIKVLIGNLEKYSAALENNDADEMSRLISQGRELKEENLRKRIGEPN